MATGGSKRVRAMASGGTVTVTSADYSFAVQLLNTIWSGTRERNELDAIVDPVISEVNTKWKKLTTNTNILKFLVNKTWNEDISTYFVGLLCVLPEKKHTISFGEIMLDAKDIEKFKKYSDFLCGKLHIDIRMYRSLVHFDWTFDNENIIPVFANIDRTRIFDANFSNELTFDITNNVIKKTGSIRYQQK